MDTLKGEYNYYNDNQFHGTRFLLAELFGSEELRW